MPRWPQGRLIAGYLSLARRSRVTILAERETSNPLCRRSLPQSNRKPEVALSCRAAAPVWERAGFERAILMRRRDPAERVGAGRAAASCRPLL